MCLQSEQGLWLYESIVTLAVAKPYGQKKEHKTKNWEKTQHQLLYVLFRKNLLCSRMSSMEHWVLYNRDLAQSEVQPPTSGSSDSKKSLSNV